MALNGSVRLLCSGENKLRFRYFRMMQKKNGYYFKGRKDLEVKQLQQGDKMQMCGNIVIFPTDMVLITCSSWISCS